MTTIAQNTSTQATVEPIFRNLTDALRFAYLYSTVQYAQTPLSRLVGPSGLGTGRGLVGLDGAAQAGMIRAAVDRLNTHKRAAIIARFADPHENYLIWMDAIYRLAVWAVPTGASHMRVRQELVAKYFGVRLYFKDIAERYGINRKSVSEIYSAMVKRLRDVETAAQNELFDEFKQRGLIECI